MTIDLSRLRSYQLVLLPAVQTADAETCHAALEDGDAGFLDFLLSQDMGAIWLYALQSEGMLASLPSDVIEKLRQARRVAAVAYLAQRAALNRLHRLFEAECIPYVVMKGAHVRECVYPEPSIRLCADIDVLIAPENRFLASRVLIAAGYEFHADPTNISHEATFTRAGVDIDLHWNILRPGRTRFDVTAGFLARRQRVNGVWGLSDSDTLFLMLTHPAFAKYVCSPNMGLARVADFLFWIQNKPTDWHAVLSLLEQSGLKTAAWTMLRWFGMLTPANLQKLIHEWQASTRPGWMRSAYLEFWLRHDLPSRWLQHPLPIQVGFTLFMHDRPGDALLALKGWWQSRNRAQFELDLMLEQTQNIT